MIEAQCHCLPEEMQDVKRLINLPSQHKHVALNLYHINFLSSEVLQLQTHVNSKGAATASRWWDRSCGTH